MPTVYTEVEVDVDLEEIADDDLLDELDRRGLGTEAASTTATELIHTIYQKRRLGQSFEHELDLVIYAVTGKIV